MSRKLQAPRQAAKPRQEEPGSHWPLSLPPVGAKQCQAAEGGANSQVDPSASTCLSLNRTNSILACTVNKLNEARSSIELNEVPASIKPNEVRSKFGHQDPSRSPDPKDWNPGVEPVKSRYW